MPLRTARADIRLITELLTLAEREALALGESAPAAEHLLLAAVSLPDDSAAIALGHGADEVRAAIGAVHAQSLASVGVAAPAGLDAPAAAPLLYGSTPTARDVFQRARVLAKKSPTGLRTAHVLLAAVDQRHGTVSRVLDHLGVDRASVATRAEQALGAP
jgi:ATP-dependent Clp protease ATP-binding subunit ClpA